MKNKLYKKLYLIYKQKYYEQLGGSEFTLTTMAEFDNIFERYIKLKFNKNFDETNFLRYILTRPSIKDKKYYYGTSSYYYNNYVNNLSDHFILSHIKENKLFISLNVEHIESMPNNINNNLRYILKEEYNINEEKLRKIINLKNIKIRLYIQHIIDTSTNITDIIINIQEGYTSIYKELVENLRFAGNIGKASKLICQNVYEGFSDIPLSTDPTKDISTTFEPDYFNHTRCDKNGCFFTIVFNKDVSFSKLTYLDDTLIDNNESILGKHICREQEISTNLLYTRPTELYISIYNERKHEVSKGTIMLICKSILVTYADMNILNVHLNPNYLIELKDKIDKNE